MGQTAQGVHVATTFLRDYLNLIDQLLEDGRFHEATQHCRHILLQYPRHIPTYRALAKALLEQHLYTDAEDIFQRVLSADPNDFIAHVGLSLIHRQAEQLDQSVWHMERAFELEPFNSVIQQELQALYRKVGDKRASESIFPNRQALAHLYYRNEMYSLATNELQALRTENGDRVDLDVLLAKTLWRSGQRVEAVNLCLQVLDKLPNCIAVNAILGEIWLLTGRVDEARTYLHRLQELTLLSKQDFDPETAVGRAFCVAGAPLLPDSIQVETLDVMGGESAGTAGGADWADDDLESEDEEIYSWLHALQIPSESPGLEDEHAAHGERKSDWFLDEMPTATATIPEEDWLAQLDDVSGLLTPDEEPASSPATGSPAFSIEDSEPTAGVENMPEWLMVSGEDAADISQLDADSAVDWLSLEDLDAVREKSGQTDWFSDPTQQKLEVESDWFVDHGEHESESPDLIMDFEWPESPDSSGEPKELETPGMSDWLSADVPADHVADEGGPETAVAYEEPQPEEEQQLIDWLMDEPLDAAPAAEEPSSEGEDQESEANIPQWLMTAPLDELPPDLLDEAEAEAAPVEEEAEWSVSETEEEFEWLFTEDGETAVADEGEFVDTAIPIAEDALELSELSESPGIATNLFEDGQEELPDWLLSSDLGEPMLAEEDDDDGFLDDLFGSLEGAVIDDVLTVGEAENSAEKTPGEEEEPPPVSSEMLTEEGWLDGTDGEELESGELPSWLFGTSLGDSDEITSPTGNVGLSELEERPQLASKELDETELPEWLSVADTPTEVAEEEVYDAFDLAEEAPGAEDADEAAMASFAATGMAVDASLEERGSSLLDWLREEPTDTGEMEAVEMADKEEMAQPVPEMPEDKPAPEEIEEATDWLQELADASGPEGAEARLEPAELPDWIQDLSQTGSLPAEGTPDALLDELLDEEGGVEEVGSGATEMLDWLQEDTAVPGKSPSPDEEEAFELDFGDEADGQDTSMLWLEALAAEEEQPQDSLEELAAVPQEEELVSAPLDLNDLPEEAEPITAEADALSWLDEMTSEPGDMLQIAEEEPLPEAEEALNWLADLETADSPAEDAFITEPHSLAEDLPQDEAATADASAWLAELATDYEPVEDTQGDEEPFEGLDFDLDEDEAAAEALELDDLLAEFEAETEAGDWLEDSGPALPEDEQPELTFAADEEDMAEEEPAIAEREEIATDWLDAQAAPEEMPEDEFAASAPEMEEEQEGGDWLDEQREEQDEAEVQPEYVAEAGADAEKMADEAALLPKMSDEAGEEAEEGPETVLTQAEMVPEADSWLGDLLDDEEELDTEAILDDLLGSEDVELDEWPEDLADETAGEAFAQSPQTAVTQEEATEPLPAPEAEPWMAADEDWLDLAAEEDSEEEDVAAWLDGLADESAETAVSDSDQLEDEEVDVLAWLGDLAAETVDELDVAAEEGPLEETPESALVVEEEHELGDEEEALTWLGDLAENIPDQADRAAEEITEINFPEDAMFPRDVGVPTDVPEELDDTMAWLAELAAEQGVSLEELDLAEAAEHSPDLPEPDMPVADSEEIPSAEIDDAMAWLEHLAAEQATPIESLPTVADRALAELPDEEELALPSKMAEAADTELVFPEDAMFPSDVGEPTDVPEEVDEAMDWLQDLMAEQGLEPEAESQATPSPVAEMAEPATGAEPEPALDELPPAEAEAEDELTLVLDWLEAIALVDAAKVEVDPDTPVVDPVATDLFAALDWVEQQLSGPEAEVDADLGIDVDEIPEDPEMALAWLADMAEDDESAVEVTAVAAPEAPSEDELGEDIPEDPDALMAWLEQHAEEEEDEGTGGEVETAVPAETAADTRAETEIIFPEDAMFPRDVGVPTDVPEELEDSMDWLQDLMAEQGLTMDELDADAEPAEQPETAVAQVVEFGEKMSREEEVPAADYQLTEEETLPDEADDALEIELLDEPALALDKAPLAAGEESAELSAAPEEPEAEHPEPPAAAAPDAAEEPETLEMEDAETTGDSHHWLNEYAVDEKAGYLEAEADVGEPVDFSESAPDTLGTEYDINAELAESWPEWLKADQKEGAGIGETGWLKSFGETDVSSWLAAEDEVMSSGIFEDIVLPDTGPLRSGTFDVGALPEVDTGLFSEESPTMSEPSVMALDEEQLQTARAALNRGAIEQAVQGYKQLIESGQGLGIIIPDLETAVQSNPKEPTIRRLLGDAYMRNGQLQKALDTYRQALDTL